MKPYLSIVKFQDFQVCYCSWNGDTILGARSVQTKIIYRGKSYEKAIKVAEEYSKEHNIEYYKAGMVKQYEKKMIKK